MLEYKLIAFDMDGTLLNSKKEISKETLKAIHTAVEAGKFISYSTGRNMQEMKKIISENPDIKYCIAISGALVTDLEKNKIIFTKALPHEYAVEIFKRIKGYDCMVHIHSNISLVQRDKEAHMADYNMGQYQRFFDELAVKAESIEEYYLENHDTIPVYKFNLYCRDQAQRLELEALLKDLPITMSYAETASLECSALGISKGFGLKALCKYLNIDTSETIAVGDAENDLEILRTAGLSVAMDNAKEIVKETAAVTVQDCDHDGCATAIYDYLLK